jgi:hypothetical protein
MIDRLIEIGRRYRMEMKVERNKVMRISRQPSPTQIMVDQKQPKNVEYFNYLGSMITNDSGVHVKLNPGLPWQKQHSARRWCWNLDTSASISVTLGKF